MDEWLRKLDAPIFVADCHAILHALSQVFDDKSLIENAKTSALLEALPRQSQELLWLPLKEKAYQPRLFEDENIASILPGLSRNNNAGLLQLYSSILCMHSYVAGYHWNAANQEDRHVLLGYAIGAVCNNTSHLIGPFVSFVSWMQRENGEESSRPFEMLALSVMLIVAAELYVSSAIDTTNNCEDELQLPVEMSTSKRWLLRLDIHEVDGELDTAWTLPSRIMMLQTRQLRTSVEVFQKLWDRWDT